MRTTRIALVAVTALLVAGIAPAASAASAPTARELRHARTLAYWTAERIASAVPRDRVFDPVRGYRPAKGKPGGGTSTTVGGASWTGGGAALTGTGRMLFTIGGGNYICSASLVTDGTSSIQVVLTAGHCVAENDGSTVATNVVYIPSFDTAPTYTCANTTYGCWVADEIYLDKNFLNAGGFNNQAVTHDWAFFVVGSGGKNGNQVDAATGGTFPIQFASVDAGETLHAFGYPAAGKYNGSDLVYCKGPLGTDPNTGGATWSMGCNMTGGSSGGPWFETTDPTSYASVLSSVNSYGYSGGSLRNRMFGPKFNSRTEAAFTAAKGGTLDGGIVHKVVLP